MKYLVTGATGQLGYDIVQELERRGLTYIAPTREDMPLEDDKRIEAYLTIVAPDVVIHCAAYTAVDKAEDEADIAWRINAEATAVIARVCRRIGALLVYISTDYVFPGDGEEFYGVNAPKGPKNVYGATKLAGEIAVHSSLERYFIVRISWVFGTNGNNFIKTMLRLAEKNEQVKVVADQIGSPTYTADAAPRIIDLASTDYYGTYHLTNEETCSWAELAMEVFRLSKLPTLVVPISTAEYPTRAKRPLNSRMDKKNLMSAGISRMPAWQDALRRYLIALESQQNQEPDSAGA